MGSKLNHSWSTSKDVRAVYQFEKVLDKGSTGTVYQVRNHKTKDIFACKSISKAGLTNEDVEEARKEIRIMRHLGSHPYIVGVVDVFEDRKDLHLIMQLCTGGELFQRLASRQRVSEAEAAKCLYAVMRVIHHCHSMNVVHRGIQPENFLVEAVDQPVWCLRAIDFGGSCFVRDDEKLTEVVGCPHYVAPEVLKGSYNREADCWSAGVMLYILLAGRPPFDGENDEQVLLRILSAPLDLRSGVWKKISNNAKDLVRNLLSRNPRRRLTAEEVLSHEWMCHHVEEARQQAAAPELLVRMQAYAEFGTLHKQVLRICASQLPEEQVAGLRTLFNSIDRDHDGTVTVGELIRGLRKRGARNLSVEDVDRILSQMRTISEHKLQFDEFLAATMHTSMMETDVVLKEAFKQLDKDHSGSIDKAELEAMLRQTGYLQAGYISEVGEIMPTDPALVNGKIQAHVLTQQEYESLLVGIDTNGDGLIDYQEFCNAMVSHQERRHGTQRLLPKPAVSPARSYTASSQDSPYRFPNSPTSQESPYKFLGSPTRVVDQVSRSCRASPLRHSNNPVRTSSIEPMTITKSDRYSPSSVLNPERFSPSDRPSGSDRDSHGSACLDIGRGHSMIKAMPSVTE